MPEKRGKPISAFAAAGVAIFLLLSLFGGIMLSDRPVFWEYIIYATVPFRDNPAPDAIKALLGAEPEQEIVGPDTDDKEDADNSVIVCALSAKTV